MKVYSAESIRNFAIVGHSATGKTTLAEAILLNAGAIGRMGSIAEGNTVSDFHDDEKKRQISIHASVMECEWLETKLNLIDTPGYADFIGESQAALRVGDFALLVISAQNGIEVGTEEVSKYAFRWHLPRVFAVNGVDLENVDFDSVLAQVRTAYGKKVFPVSLPVDAGPGFHRILDVFRSEIITYATDRSGRFTEEPAEGEWKDKVDELHGQLIEFVAEADDSLLEKYLEKGCLSEEEMRHGLHHAIQERIFIPVFAISAQHNIGVTRLMDFVAKYGSSPVDRKVVEALDEQDNPVNVTLDGQNPVLYVFKTLGEAHLGEMSLFRVYSGGVKAGAEVYNASRGVHERIGQLFQLNGKKRIPVDELRPGDIGATVKLKDTHTDNTLCSSKRKVRLLKVRYADPNYHMAIVAKGKGDEEKLAVGLATLHEEDPTFQYYVNSELKQTVLSGRGELHLQIICERLKERFKVAVSMVVPRIAYRETIRGKGESKYRHKKQSGGAGQFAEVWLRLEPKDRGEGIDFSHSLSGQNVDRVFVPSVEKGVKAACAEGILAGYKVADVKINFYDGKQHPVDSKDIAFQIAGKHAFQEAFLQARPCLLEPIMDVEIRVPEVAMGDVMGDISSRRGHVLGMETDGHFQVILAKVPQAELHQYATTLRSLTAGRGIHSETFSHYEQAPTEVEKKVIKESKSV